MQPETIQFETIQPETMQLETTQPKTQQYYAQSKLEESAHIISLATQELPAMRRKLDSLLNTKKERAKGIYEDMQKLMLKLVDALKLCYFSLEEMEEGDLAAYTTKLISSVNAFKIMTPDYSQLCKVLKQYIAQLPSQSETVNARVIGRLMNRVKLGYYPTDLEHIGHIERGIEFPDGITTNLLDPCCGCGLALRSLADGNNCYAYGVEMDESRANEALTRLHRVGFGSFFYSRISHEAFHAILLNPPYLSVLGENGQNFRSEKRFLSDSICHLMIGGLLIYIIPYYRLTEDVCRVLCDNFEDISVWKFFGKEFKRFNQVAVMGIRKKRTTEIELAAQLSGQMLDIESLPELSLIPDGRYALPAEPLQIKLFKGAQFNAAELAEQLKKSDSFTRLFQQNKLDEMEKRPLLPLKIGQVGLIGGSGLINGLIECENTHILKGRIIKTTSIREEQGVNAQGNAITTVHEVESNKMVFNILTPYGFKSLTA